MARYTCSTAQTCILGLWFDRKFASVNPNCRRCEYAVTVAVDDPSEIETFEDTQCGQCGSVVSKETETDGEEQAATRVILFRRYVGRI